MTLEGKTILKEGWITLSKSKKPGLFSSKQQPDKPIDRGWAVLHQFSSKGPIITFYQDNRKENKVMRKEKVELIGVLEVTRMVGHPKYPHGFALKYKGSKRMLLNADTEHDLDSWLKVVCELTEKQYKREKVIWEYLDDGGLWQALPSDVCYRIEAHFNEQSTSFHLGDAQLAFHYNLQSMNRTHPRTRHVHRIKRTPFVEEQVEVLHTKMMDLPAIWEWGDPSKEEWHPFERDTNIQIEDMYDSGSQWAELTLCLPSPMPFLLDLHDMKLVNFRTAVRYSLRRVDNSANIQQDSTYPEPRSPSPDDFETPFHEAVVSPMSPIFQSLQGTLQRLQFPRKSITYKQMIGEGAFGDVHLAEATGLPGYGDKAVEVAVKQLRLSDFIARHGHHSQQMEDFLREAKEMAKVDHHHVVKLIAVCTLDYPMLLIEEYMNQGDLLGVLKDSRPHMPLTRQLMFACHVADGMDYLADTLNCVHRDLAARNILVHQSSSEEKVVAKIADFGLSRHLYSEMYKHQGTKPRPLPAKWMALESLMYFIFTSKSDVWSFGVLLWEIMTLGRTPYPGVENRELLEQIEEKGLKLSKPRPCPNVLFEMILDCMQHEPDERPTFKQLHDKLLEFFREAEEGRLVTSDDGESLPNSPAPWNSTSSTGGLTGASETMTTPAEYSRPIASPGRSTSNGDELQPPQLPMPPPPKTPPPPTAPKPQNIPPPAPPGGRPRVSSQTMTGAQGSPRGSPARSQGRSSRLESSGSRSESSGSSPAHHCHSPAHHPQRSSSSSTQETEHEVFDSPRRRQCPAKTWSGAAASPWRRPVFASPDRRQGSDLSSGLGMESPDGGVSSPGKTVEPSPTEISAPFGHVYYLLDPLDPSDIDITMVDREKENGTPRNDTVVTNHVHDRELSASPKDHQQLINKGGEPISSLNSNGGST